MAFIRSPNMIAAPLHVPFDPCCGMKEIGTVPLARQGMHHGLERVVLTRRALFPALLGRWRVAGRRRHGLALVFGLFLLRCLQIIQPL
jgi:hypothetical protein